MESAPAPDDSAAEFLQLIAEPVRWNLMRELATGDRRVHELTDLLGKPQNLVSYHLRALRDAELVSTRRSSADGRDTYYRVDLARCGQMFSTVGAALHPGLRLRIDPRAVPLRSDGQRCSVLFLCTGNSARSQIAQALLEDMSNHTVDARSAGSHPKTLHPNAVRVMAARGIDISDRSTTHLDQFSEVEFDYVVTLCDRVREICPEFPGHPTRAHWSIADPALEGDSDDESLPAFERTAREIEERVGFLLPRLIDLDQPKERAHVN